MKTLSNNIHELETIFDLLNNTFFESALSKAVVTVQSSPMTYGHCSTAPMWTEKQGKERYEINVSAEHLTRPIQNTIATLLHEMVHQYCAEKGIKDTSRGGTYHNKQFKTESEKRGLVISHDKKYGWTLTEPGAALIDFLEANDIKNSFDVARKAILRLEGKTKKSSTRKYICPCCGMSVRSTKEVNIICGDCEEAMICEDDKNEGESHELAAERGL